MQCSNQRSGDISVRYDTKRRYVEIGDTYNCTVCTLYSVHCIFMNGAVPRDFILSGFHYMYMINRLNGFSNNSVFTEIFAKTERRKRNYLQRCFIMGL